MLRTLPKDVSIINNKVHQDQLFTTKHCKSMQKTALPVVALCNDREFSTVAISKSGDHYSNHILSNSRNNYQRGCQTKTQLLPRAPVTGVRRNSINVILAMKLTFILLTAAFLNVSATAVSQNISFTGTNVPLTMDIQGNRGTNWTGIFL